MPLNPTAVEGIEYLIKPDLKWVLFPYVINVL